MTWARPEAVIFLLFAGLTLTPMEWSAQAPPAVVKVVGESHMLALRSDGTVVGWRHFRHGQLGPVAPIDRPGPIIAEPVPIVLPGKVIDIAAGDFTSYALTEDGAVWAWGRGDSGQLGTGPKPALPLLPSDNKAFEHRGQEQPVRVRAGAAVRIAAAGDTALAVLRDGTVWGWGNPGYGLLGSGQTQMAYSPVMVGGTVDVAEISVSQSHVLALTADGRVLSWGSNRYGALGREPKQEAPLAPAEVPGMTGSIAVAASAHVSTAVKKDGTVWAWGMNAHGQLGNGKRSSGEAQGNQVEPAQVAGVANAVSVAAASKGRHTLVLLKDGTLRGWGNTDFGQIGAGMTAGFQPSPVQPKIARVKAVFAVGNSSFAVKTDGTFWGWGYGNKGDWPFTVWTKAPAMVDLTVARKN